MRKFFKNTKSPSSNSLEKKERQRFKILTPADYKTTNVRQQSVPTADNVREGVYQKLLEHISHAELAVEQQNRLQKRYLDQFKDSGVIERFGVVNNLIVDNNIDELYNRRNEFKFELLETARDDVSYWFPESVTWEDSHVLEVFLNQPRAYIMYPTENRWFPLDLQWMSDENELWLQAEMDEEDANSFEAVMQTTNHRRRGGKRLNLEKKLKLVRFSYSNERDRR